MPSARFMPYNHPGQARPSGRSTASNITQIKSAKQKRHAHTNEEWEAIREPVIRIYIVEDKSVDELIRTLKDEHNFAVRGVRIRKKSPNSNNHSSKRKLHDWMTKQNISKNESKANMGVLFAKRENRRKNEGKKTIMFKDGRVITDDKLDRWGAKYAATLDVLNHLAATTPEGYTIRTPRPTNSYSDTSSSDHKALHDLFVAEKSVQTTFGAVIDEQDIHQSDNHLHQIGVLGLRMVSGTFDSKSTVLLQRSICLARDLVSAMLAPLPHGHDHYVSSRPTPNTRVPKVNISFTGCSRTVYPFLASKIVTLLQESETCVRLLQLCPSDCKKWQQDWYAMASEEKSVTEKFCTAFFGSLSSFDPAITYIHVTVFLESPNRPTDTILTRFSVGIDTRPSSECKLCQRRVFTMDSISEKTAVKLNVPLQSAWQGSWEPEPFEAVAAVTRARWDDYVYAFRGWFIKLPLVHTSLGWDDTKEMEDAWDPMDSNNVPTVFQPREMAAPAGCCAFNHAGFVCQCIPGHDEKFNANPDEEGSLNVVSSELRNECWDPNDSLPRSVEIGAFDISEEELAELDFG